ncbi:MAG: hypothetical protein NT027_05020 [Proteobacteria bacterium]|nr:hypothetical protein [Pseudomonadota bacterium]
MEANPLRFAVKELLTLIADYKSTWGIRGPISQLQTQRDLDVSLKVQDVVTKFEGVAVEFSFHGFDSNALIIKTYSKMADVQPDRATPSEYRPIVEGLPTWGQWLQNRLCYEESIFGSFYGNVTIPIHVEIVQQKESLGSVLSNLRVHFLMDPLIGGRHDLSSKLDFQNGTGSLPESYPEVVQTKIMRILDLIQVANSHSRA